MWLAHVLAAIEARSTRTSAVTASSIRPRLVRLNLIAVAVHTAADLAAAPWREARTAAGTRKRTFEDLRADHLSGVPGLGRPMALKPWLRIRSAGGRGAGISAAFPTPTGQARRLRTRGRPSRGGQARRWRCRSGTSFRQTAAKRGNAGQACGNSSAGLRPLPTARAAADIKSCMTVRNLRRFAGCRTGDSPPIKPSNPIQRRLTEPGSCRSVVTAARCRQP